MMNVVVICVGFTGIVLNTYLLTSKHIGSVAYTSLFLGILIFCFALLYGERLLELDLKNLKVTLSEIKKTKEEIYAKAETVRELGEEVSEIATFTLTRLGRWGCAARHAELLKHRIKLESMLKALGSEPNRISSIIAMIDDMVLFDLRGNLIDEYRKYAEANNVPKDEMENKQKILVELLESYDSNNKKTDIIDLIKSTSALNDEFLKIIDKFDAFIKTRNF